MTNNRILTGFEKKFSFRTKIIIGIILIMAGALGFNTLFDQIAQSYSNSIKSEEVISFYENVKQNTEKDIQKNLAKVLDGLNTSETFLNALKAENKQEIKALFEGNFLNYETTLGIQLLALFDSKQNLLASVIGDGVQNFSTNQITGNAIQILAEKAQKSMDYEKGWLLVGKKPLLVFLTSLIDANNKTLGYVLAGFPVKIFLETYSNRIDKIAILAGQTDFPKDKKESAIVKSLMNSDVSKQIKRNTKVFTFDHDDKIMKSHTLQLVNPQKLSEIVPYSVRV